MKKCKTIDNEMKMCYINGMKNENKKTVDNKMEMCYLNNVMEMKIKIKNEKSVDNETKMCYINSMKTCKLEKLLICFEIGALLTVVTLIVINL